MVALQARRYACRISRFDRLDTECQIRQTAGLEKRSLHGQSSPIVWRSDIQFRMHESDEIEPAKPFEWRRWLSRSILTLCVLAATYLGVSLWLGWSKLEGALEGLFRYNILPWALGLVFSGVLLRAARWHYYVYRLRWHVGPIDSITAFLASFALTITPGKAGELVKSMLLRMTHEIPVAQSAGVLVVERLTDLIAVSLLALGGLTSFSGLKSYGAAALAGIIAAAFFLGSRRIYLPFLEGLRRIRIFAAIADKLLRLLNTIRSLLRFDILLIGIALATVAWSCEALFLHILTINMLPTLAISPWMSFSVFGLATLVGALGMLPGGVGGFEAVMILLLTQLGANAVDAAVLVMLFRLCTLWLVSFIGFGFMLFWMAAHSPRMRPRGEMGVR
jgi:uncharacterized protein (TIRG00374 family)